MPDPFDTGDPAGTLVLKHRYAAPANGAPFTVAVTAKLGAESQTVAIGVTPRYKVAVSDIEFFPLSHCDTAAEEDTEWKVGRGCARERNRHRAEPGMELRPCGTNPRVVVGDWSLPQFEALPGSGFSVELKASDHPRLGLSITEVDPLIDDTSSLLQGTGASTRSTARAPSTWWWVRLTRIPISSGAGPSPGTTST